MTWNVHLHSTFYYILWYAMLGSNKIYYITTITMLYCHNNIAKCFSKTSWLNFLLDYLAHIRSSCLPYHSVCTLISPLLHSFPLTYSHFSFPTLIYTSSFSIFREFFCWLSFSFKYSFLKNIFHGLYLVQSASFSCDNITGRESTSVLCRLRTYVSLGLTWKRWNFKN